MIDAHQHFWRIGSAGHEWPTPDLWRIHRDFEPEEWERLARPLGFTASVAVQSQPNASDTAWLLALAERNPAIRAVVGWTDLKADDAPDAIGRLARHPRLKGLRPMLQSLPEDWISDPALDPAIAAMVAHGLRFDALVFTRHLPALRSFAQRWPELQIVIDHGAKPLIARGDAAEWRREMEAIAALPNLWCKLSGLLTEKAEGQSTGEVRPYVRHLCDLFGPGRLMWGSDWPVLLLAGEYEGWFRIAREQCGFDEAGLAQLFGETAATFYGIATA